jgi:hypothetical protein
VLINQFFGWKKPNLGKKIGSGKKHQVENQILQPI